MQEELVWVADSQIDLGSGVEPENFLLKKIMKLCDLQLEALGWTPFSPLEFSVPHKLLGLQFVQFLFLVIYSLVEVR